jgi:hypothetical protein
MKTGAFMYCPAAVDPYYQYNGEDNPYDPANKNTRAGFFLRPMYYDGTPVLWRTTGTDDAPPVTSPPAIPWTTYPKLTRMQYRVLASDIFSTPHRINYRHRTGINVVYSDGSAKWIDRKPFDRLPQTWVPPTGSGWPSSVIIFSTLDHGFVAGAGANGTIASIWEYLDRQGGARPNPDFVFPQ